MNKPSEHTRTCVPESLLVDINIAIARIEPRKKCTWSYIRYRNVLAQDSLTYRHCLFHITGHMSSHLIPQRILGASTWRVQLKKIPKSSEAFRFCFGGAWISISITPSTGILFRPCSETSGLVCFVYKPGLPTRHAIWSTCS